MLESPRALRRWWPISKAEISFFSEISVSCYTINTESYSFFYAHKVWNIHGRYISSSFIISPIHAIPGITEAWKSREVAGTRSLLYPLQLFTVPQLITPTCRRGKGFKKLLQNTLNQISFCSALLYHVIILLKFDWS